MEVDRKIGYIYEVSMRVPEHSHDKLSDLPLLPKKIIIDKSLLSAFQREMWPESDKHPAERLTLNLLDKNKYAMHYRTLQFCLEIGLKIVEIHCVLRFEQKAWLKPYVDFNTKKRAEASLKDNKFLQMFHKLLVNILYGKCVQNL